MILFAFLILRTVFVNGASIDPKEFELTVLHFNDFHARFEPINKFDSTCNKTQGHHCYGGFSRMYSEVIKLKNQNPDSIILNAGDNFQGSLWYTFYKWEAVAHFLNKIPIDVHTIGNHEFDDQVDGVVPLLRKLQAPIVISNIDDRNEPDFQHLYKKSVVLERSGRKIGVIGAIVTNTAETSRPGKLKFLNEVDSINNEAKRLVSEHDVDTIIVLSHCGYFTDVEIAKKAVDRIGLIVGGHSHSLLYNGVPPNNLTVHGSYPTIVPGKNGRNVLIVQASAFTKFVGEIQVRYNKEGNPIWWKGVPFYLDESVASDGAIDKEIKEWQKKVDDFGNKELGITLVKLDNSNCYNFQCSLGDFIADAMVHAYSNTDYKNATIALINSGALRRPINKGRITVRNLLEMAPFGNTLDVGNIKGKYIKEALEHAVVLYEGSRNLLQISGLKIVYNMTHPEGSRVQSVQVRCKQCAEPTYTELEMEKFYPVVLIAFLVNGGDGFTALSDNLVNHRVGEIDHEAYQKYIIHKSPINLSNEDNRITFV